MTELRTGMSNQNNQTSANFILKSKDGNDEVFLGMVIEDTLAYLEFQDSQENVLGEIAFAIKNGKLLARINRTGYNKESPQEITIFHL
jgi:hypothetical protein